MLIFALLRTFPGRTVHAPSGENLGDAPAELISLHATQELADEALNEAILAAKKDTEQFMCDMPEFRTEPYNVQ